MLSSEIVMNLLPKIRDCFGYSHNNSFLISSNRSSLFQSLCRVIRQPDYTIRELLTKDRGPDRTALTFEAAGRPLPLTTMPEAPSRAAPHAYGAQRVVGAS